MDFLNYKSMSNEEIEKYLTKISKEYDKTAAKVEKLCSEIIELREEYEDVENEIKNRKKIN